MILFCVQLGLMLLMSLGCGRIMQRFNQPRVLGELFGGILLGPTLFGALAPGLYAGLFPAAGNTAVLRGGIIRIGMLFFMFVAGLEVQLSQARRLGAGIAMTSGLGIAVPFALGYGMVLLFPGLWGAPALARTQTLALCIAAALSISALPVIGRILIDLGLMDRRVGVVVMTAATVNDLLSWSVFALIVGTLGPGATWTGAVLQVCAVICLIPLALGPGRWLAASLLRRMRAPLIWPSGLVGIIAVLVLLSAACAEAIGVHAVFGPFLVGMALGQGLKGAAQQQAHGTISQFALSFFAPLYFVSIGLGANFAADFDWVLVGLVVLVATLGKVCGGGLGAFLGGMDRREALAVGFGLNARGAMDIILASVALEYGIIDRRIFVALVVMALVTSMASGPAMQYFMRQSDSKTHSETATPRRRS